jgi:hypothetical protein
MELMSLVDKQEDEVDYDLLYDMHKEDLVLRNVEAIDEVVGLIASQTSRSKREVVEEYLFYLESDE